MLEDVRSEVLTRAEVPDDEGVTAGDYPSWSFTCEGSRVTLTEYVDDLGEEVYSMTTSPRDMVYLRDDVLAADAVVDLLT